MSEKSMTHEKTDHLLGCLETELTLSGQLLELGRLQERALVESENEKLAEITHAQDTKLRQLAGARKRSEASVLSLALDLGLESETPTLTELASALEEPYSSHLEQMVIRLVDAASMLYNQNLVNKNLLSNAVQYVTFCLRLLSGTEEQTSYKAGGFAQSRPSSLVLDRTV